MNEHFKGLKIPKFLGERIINDDDRQFGKTVVKRDFRINGGVSSILCITGVGRDPCIIFPVTARRTVWLIRQYRFATREFIVELPGGCRKPGQGWRKCASAELLQEIGAKAESMQVLGKPTAFNPALQDARFTAVLAIGCQIVLPQRLDETESITPVEISLEKFRLNLRNGEYTDAKTIVTGYLALDHLGLLHY